MGSARISTVPPTQVTRAAIVNEATATAARMRQRVPVKDRKVRVQSRNVLDYR